MSRLLRGFFSFCLIFLFSFLASCADKDILYTDRLSFASIAVNGKPVLFDRDRDFYVYPVDLGANTVRIRLSVVENDGDVFFSIKKKGGALVANDSQTTLVGAITPFFIRIQNIKGDYADKVIYITKGNLPSLFIKDNLFLETGVKSLVLNGNRSVLIEDNDYAGLVFNGNVGDDLLAQGKAKIVERPIVSSEEYNTFATLRSYQTRETLVSLKLLSSKEAQFSLDGEYSGVGRKTGYIDIEFDPSAFSGLTDDHKRVILYDNTYVFRYQFGNAKLSVADPVFVANPDRTVSTQVAFKLEGASFKKDGTFDPEDDTVEILGLPYDYVAKITVNGDLSTGSISLGRKYLFLTKGHYSFIVKFQKDFFKDISNQDEIAGFAQRFYIEVP